MQPNKRPKNAMPGKVTASPANTKAKGPMQHGRLPYKKCSA